MPIQSIPSIQQVNDLIRLRRSVFPDDYLEGEIDRATIELILENANWAPNHKKTEPWRFKVFQDAAKSRLGGFLAERYKELADPSNFKQAKYDKTIRKVDKSSVIIAICMQRDAKKRVPEWEELAAVACAVQNMWLSCVSLDIGCYWSSPKSITNDREFLKLKVGERCLGLFCMGYWKQRKIKSTRSPIAEKVEWVKE